MNLRRSFLSTPASDREMIRKAAASDADEVALDLEDAVIPEEKPGARENVIASAREDDWSDTGLSVRINGLATKYCYRDVVTLVEAVGDELDTLLVPKVDGGEDVYVIETLLGQIEAQADIETPVGISVLVESATGLENVGEIAAASDRLESLVFGSGDYSASIGIPPPSTADGRGFEYPGDLWHSVRSRILNAAKANDLDAIDGPYADFDDTEAHRDHCETSAALGFDGKFLIHPNQIEAANEVYGPSEADIEHAREIVDALEEGDVEGKGAVNLDGVMVDIAHYQHARSILEAAEATGKID
jgi:citrate lyase subunit beta/citryl-CoA lyase